MLKKLGIVADVAANVLEVLQALEGQQYDMVLRDIQRIFRATLAQVARPTAVERCEWYIGATTLIYLQPVLLVVFNLR